MRLIYPSEQPKLPLAIKIFFCSIVLAIAGMLGMAAFVIFIVVADPHKTGETFGEVGASIVNGFNRTLED